MALCTVATLGGCLSPASGNPDRVPVAPTSMFFEQSHHFCSDRLKDRFLIGYYGDALLDTVVYFFVVAHTGDTIYRDQWPAIAHLEDQDNAQPSDSSKIGMIEAQMRELVNHTQNDPNQLISDSLSQAMQLGPAFHYRVGTKRDRTIAFSKADKSVVVL